MLGIIERIKNNVLQKCSALNDKAIQDDLINVLDADIYHFSEDLFSMIQGIDIRLSEEDVRNATSNLLKDGIIKKFKRKLFIDSLALQITNDTFIEEIVNKKITISELKEKYIKELKKNENSNQLNMTENLKLNEFFDELHLYINKNVISMIKENVILTKNVTSLLKLFKKDMENHLENLVDEIDKKYLSMLLNELEVELEGIEENTDQVSEVYKETEIYQEIEEGDVDIMYEQTNNVEEDIIVNENVTIEQSNKFVAYDDMTLFNKMILSLNTKDEKLSRLESKLSQRKEEVERCLTSTNVNIEENDKREKELIARKNDLDAKEVEINSKLSEVEVIFLNMKPLIKGLNNITAAAKEGGNL